MYHELADWWPVLSAPEEYAEEAEAYRRALVDACERPPRTVLELGSGGGNNASFLKRHFEMTLVDLAPRMLDVSRILNPECAHREGDMRTIRLNRTFDAVFVHDAISYMTTETELAQAIDTAYVHCAPGGAALFAPDYVKETFDTSTEHGGHDSGARHMRYLEWVWDPDPTDTAFVTDYAFLLREGNGATRVEHDRHVEGLFGRAVWLRLIEACGFIPQPTVFHHTEVDRPLDIFIGRKPTESSAG